MVFYGLAVAIVFNISAIGVTIELHENDVVRDTVVSLAESEAVAIDAVEDCATRTCVEEKVSSLLDTGLPLWWRECGYLVFSDIGQNWRMKYEPGERVTVFQEERLSPGEKGDVSQ